VSGAALRPVVLLPVVLMRGGTSKGVFARDDDLPAPGPDRDTLLVKPNAHSPHSPPLFLQGSQVILRYLRL
jgi:hypothetical protein